MYLSVCHTLNTNIYMADKYKNMSLRCLTLRFFIRSLLRFYVAAQPMCHQQTLLPGFTSRRIDVTLRLPSKFSAERIMP